MMLGLLDVDDRCRGTACHKPGCALVFVDVKLPETLIQDLDQVHVGVDDTLDTESGFHTLPFLLTDTQD